MDNTNMEHKVVDNEKLEEVMELYVKEQTTEHLSTVLNHLRNAHLFVPAVFPEGSDLSFLKEAQKGERVQIPSDIHPLPSVLRNQKEEQYLPLYTRKEEIPKDQKFHTILEVTFRGSYMTALKEGSKLDGVALNPFHENILIKKPLLEKLKQQDDMMQEGKKMVKLTPEQYLALMRRNIEQKIMPKMLYEKAEQFTTDLCDKKEDFVKAIYQNGFPKEQRPPYTSSDFSVMALNIRENLLLIRIDLPEKGIAPGLSHRVYVAWNEEQKVADYFTIEMTKQKDERAMGRVDSSLKHVDCGMAPVEGAELQCVLDMIDEERVEAN